MEISKDWIKSNYILEMASKNNGLRQRRGRNTGNSKNNRENSNAIAEQYATNHDLYGPISGALLVDPVRIRDERTPGAYEREQITRWLNDRGTSPTTRNPVTVANLEPAQDIQQEIRELVRRYPNARIVRDWLQEQPPWYTRAIQQISNVVTPPLQVMSRAVEPIRQVMPSAETCAKCCAGTVETGTGAIVGAGVGGCAGCMCALTMTSNENNPETAAALAATAIPVGAAVGAAVGSCLGPRDCLRCAGEACKHAMESNNNHWGGKRRRKTRKGRKKKRHKSRKRKVKRRKTRRRKHKKRRKTRKR